MKRWNASQHGADGGSALSYLSKFDRVVVGSGESSQSLGLGDIWSLCRMQLIGSGTTTVHCQRECNTMRFTTSTALASALVLSAFAAFDTSTAQAQFPIFNGGQVLA